MKKINILTIDDDLDFNRLLQVKLKKISTNIKTTTTPEEFLEEIKTFKPDLCIIDINLDKYLGAGFQLIQAIRNRLESQLIIFVISRRSSQEDMAYALELGANEYLPKPLDDLLLREKINQYFHTIREGGQTELPFFDIPGRQAGCEFSFDIVVSKIDEYGITFEGNHLLAKNSVFEIECEPLKDITSSEKPLRMTSTSNAFDPDRQIYTSFLEFDPYDEDLSSKVRNWLVKQQSQPRGE